MPRSPALIKAQKKYFEKMKLNSDFVADRNKRSIEYYQKHKEDEEFRKKQRERSMKYYNNNKDRVCTERREKYRINKLTKDIEKNEIIDINPNLQ
tara:strand:+ start:648 stop:932 length:285 start_codon:yes stop_codon:yes gene_type:complete